jgi:hypothetical protein
MIITFLFLCWHDFSPSISVSGCVFGKLPHKNPGICSSVLSVVIISNMRWNKWKDAGLQNIHASFFTLQEFKIFWNPLYVPENVHGINIFLFVSFLPESFFKLNKTNKCYPFLLLSNSLGEWLCWNNLPVLFQRSLQIQNSYSQFPSKIYGDDSWKLLKIVL